MFLMSGLAMAAVVIQMVLGKIAFVAAAALLLAKIALFVSTTVRTSFPLLTLNFHNNM